MDAAGAAAFRATAAAVAVMPAGNNTPGPMWLAIEPMAAAARRLMSEAGATALLLQVAPWEPGDTAWGNALAFFAAAHAYPRALIAALPAMTDAAACLAAHTLIHGYPHAPCPQEGGAVIGTAEGLRYPPTTLCNGLPYCSSSCWALVVPHLLRPALVTLLRHPAAAAAAPAQLATCFLVDTRHVLFSLGREHADLQRAALASYLSPHVSMAARRYARQRSIGNNAPNRRCLAAARMVSWTQFAPDNLGGDLAMALFVMDPVRRPPLLLPVYVEHEVDGPAAAQSTAGGHRWPEA
jgi:hypothetical protein